MLTYSLIVLAITAVGGLLLASKVLTGNIAPWSVSLIHAVLGATGLIILMLIMLQGAAPGRITAGFALLVVAALGGFYLASFHIRKEIPGKAIVIVHAGVAVAGFLTLLSVALGI